MRTACQFLYYGYRLCGLWISSVHELSLVSPETDIESIKYHNIINVRVLLQQKMK